MLQVGLKNLRKMLLLIIDGIYGRWKNVKKKGISGAFKVEE